MSACACDFCSGVKSWADNWCPRCGKVQMQIPKSNEAMDVCDACEVAVVAEVDAEDLQHRAHRMVLSDWARDVAADCRNFARMAVADHERTVRL